MTTVAPTYAYPDGSSLSATGHANNMYSATPQQGLYSSVNGELDFTNNYNGVVKKHNFQASEMLFFDQYKWERPITVFSDTGGGSNISNGEAAATIVGLRFSLPAKAESLRVGYSFFLSASRAFKVRRADENSDPYKWEATTSGSLEARLMVFWDGAEIPGLRIPLPKTLWGGKTLGTPIRPGLTNHLSTFEHLTAQQHTGSFVLTDVNTLHHNLQFKLFLENPGGKGVFTDVFGRTLGLVGKEQSLSLKLSQRLTFGTGQVNVVAKGLKTS